MTLEALKKQARNGTLQALKRLGVLSKSRRDWFLDAFPVFVHHLCSHQVPSNPNLFEPPDNTFLVVEACLQGVADGVSVDKFRTSHISRSVRDQWPKIWSWISFLVQNYIESTTLTKEAEEFSILLQTTIMSVLAAFTIPEGIAELILNTRGCTSMFMRLYLLASATSSAKSELCKLAESTWVQLDMHPDWKECRYAVIEASPTCYASDLLSRLAEVVREPAIDGPLLRMELGIIRNLVTLYTPKFSLTLLSRGSLYWIMFTIRRLTDPNVKLLETPLKNRAVTESLKLCYSYLYCTFIQRGYVAVKEALERGLLSYILVSVPIILHDIKTACKSECCHMHKTLLDNSVDLLVTMGKFSTYRSVLKRFPKILSGIEDAEEEKALEKAPKRLIEKWRAMKQVVRHRIEFKTEYDKNRFDFMHNHNCEVCIRNAATKKYRCSQCLTTYFCSKKCQESNWEEHQAYCKRTYEERMKGEPMSYDAQDYYFVLRLIEFDVTQLRQVALQKEKQYRDEHSLHQASPEVLVHVLDYTRMPVVHELVTLAEANERAPCESWDELARTARKEMRLKERDRKEGSLFLAVCPTALGVVTRALFGGIKGSKFRHC